MVNVAAIIKEFRTTWVEFKKSQPMKFLFQILFVIIVTAILINLVVFGIKSYQNKPSKFLWMPNGVEPEVQYIMKDSIRYIHDTIYVAGRDVNNVGKDQTINNR